MRIPGRPTDFFGLPFGMERSTAKTIVEGLRASWEALNPGLPQSVDEAVDWLFKHYFDPIARGQRLRQALEGVSAPYPDVPFISEELVIDLGSGRGLITPEGRVALWVLEQGLGSNDETILLRDESVLAADRLLLDKYRGRAQARLRQVVDLGKGSGNPMLPAAAAIPLFLIVNRSTSPERALRRPRVGDQRADLDRAVGSIIAAFAASVDAGGSRRGRERSLEHMSLYGGYPLTEARRRLASHLSHDAGELYVRPGEEAAVIRFVAQDLARRSLPRSRIADAFDALLTAYRAEYPILAALGAVHERSADTAVVRATLLDEYERACPSC